MSQRRYAYCMGANGPLALGELAAKLPQLRYAERDAERLAQTLKTSRCAFTETAWTVATNRKVALGGLDRFLKQSRCLPEDLLVVHFSGHGIYDGGLYLLCNETDLADLVTDAIDIGALKTKLGECQAGQKILILDSCHAGGALAKSWKGPADFAASLEEALTGSADVIICASSQLEKTRELEVELFSGGAGFLSGCFTAACDTHFSKASSDGKTLSIADIWDWTLIQRREINRTLSQKARLPEPVMWGTWKGNSSKIWLTAPPPVQVLSHNRREEERRKYLEQVDKRYSSITLPIGPTEGFSLQAIFQPLALQGDSLKAGLVSSPENVSLSGPGKVPTLMKAEQLDTVPSAEEEKPEPRVNALLAYFPAESSKLTKGQDDLSVIVENAEQALAHSLLGRIVVLGGPGTGKTTTLKHLVNGSAKKALADVTAPIPIFLSLADLAASGKTLQSYLADEAEYMGMPRDERDMLWQEIEQGHALIALDSLDEVAPGQRPKIIELINTWASKRGNIWLVGSRYTEYKGGQFNASQFAEWKLLPLNSPRRQELAIKLFPELRQMLKGADPTLPSPTAFVERLENHPYAAAWGENPLLFSLAAVIFVQTGDLPANRARLYHDMIKAVLKIREPGEVLREHLLLILEEMALRLQKMGTRAFTARDLLLFLTEEQKQVGKEAEDLAQRIISSGMLEAKARERYEFRHNTFQEYLAAAALARHLISQDQLTKEDGWKLAWSKRTYSRWTEILLLMVGILSQFSGSRGQVAALRWLQRFIEQRSTEEGDPGNLGLELALRSFEEVGSTPGWFTLEAKQIEEQFATAWSQELLHAAREQRDTQMQRLKGFTRYIRQFHRKTIDTITSTFVGVLKGKDEIVFTLAREEIQALGAWISTELLLDMLEDHSAEVRVAALEALGTQVAALEALGRQGERIPLDPVQAKLQDSSAAVRGEALQILGTVQGERVSIKTLVVGLTDADSWVQQIALRGLVQQRKRIPVKLAMSLLQDRSAAVRGLALQVLREQGERIPIEAAMSLLQDRSAAQTEISINGNSDIPPAIEIAIQALREQARQIPVQSSPALLEILAGSSSSKLLQVFKEQRVHVSLDTALDLLQDSSVTVRLAALRLLSQWGKRIPIDPVQARLQDSSAAVRREALQILGKQGPQVLIETLLTRIIDFDRKVNFDTYDNVENLLKEQREHIPLKLVLSRLADPSDTVRVAALQTLKYLRKRIPLNPVLALLKDPSARVRIWALRVLEGQKGQVPIEPLLALLDDYDNGIVEESLRVLERQGEQVPIEPVLEMLQDPIAQIRMAGLSIAKKQGKRFPLMEVSSLLQDPSEAVRTRALQVLSEHIKQVPIEDIQAVLNDFSPQVRLAAIKALRRQGEGVPIEALLAGLEDIDPNLRRMALQELERTSAEAVLTELEKYPSEGVRLAALQVLSEHTKQVFLELALTSLTDLSASVRGWALMLLEQQKRSIPITPVLERLSDPSAEVRECALRLLGLQGKRVPLEVILMMYKDTSQAVRREVIEILGKRAEPTESALIESSLVTMANCSYAFPANCKDASLHEAAYWALWDRQPSADILVLQEDASDSVRSTVLWLLKKQEKRPQLIPELYRGLLSTSQSIDLLSLGTSDFHELGRKDQLDLLDAPLPEELRWMVMMSYGVQGIQVPVKQLLTELADPSDAVREATLWVLKKQGKRIPIARVLELLQDPSEPVCLMALHVLSEQGEQVPVERVLELLTESNPPDIRVAALQALEKQGERVPIDQIIALLQDDSERVRVMALDVLCEQEKRVPIESVLKMLQDPSSPVRWMALHCLGRREKRVPIESVLKMLQDPSSPVRWMALWILRVLEEQGEQIPMKPVLEKLHDPSGRVRMMVLLALEQQGDQIPIEHLLRTLKDTDKDVRDVAAAILEKQGKRVPIDQLLEMLQGNSQTTQESVLSILGVLSEQGIKVPVEPMLKILRESAGPIQAAALQVLGKQGERVSIELFLTRLEDENEDVQRAAFEALQSQGKRVPIEKVLPLCYQPKANIRLAALKALEPLVDHSSHELLAVLVCDEDVNVREIAIRIMKKIAPPIFRELAAQAVTTLEEELTGFPLITLNRMFVAEALGNLTQPSTKTFDKLVELLDWPHWQVQLKAIQAFGKIRRNLPDSAIRRLYDLRRHPDPQMHALRQAADDTLREYLSLETGLEDDEGI